MSLLTHTADVVTLHALEREELGAIAVGSGSYKSHFPLNSGRFSLEKKGTFSSEIRFAGHAATNDCIISIPES